MYKRLKKFQKLHQLQEYDCVLFARSLFILYIYSKHFILIILPSHPTAFLLTLFQLSLASCTILDWHDYLLYTSLIEFNVLSSSVARQYLLWKNRIKMMDFRLWTMRHDKIIWQKFNAANRFIQLLHTLWKWAIQSHPLDLLEVTKVCLWERFRHVHS